MSATRKVPLRGVEIWKNPKNKFTVFQLHYLANPGKTTTEWKSDARAGLSRQKWDQEYEIKWENWMGRPVYGDYDDQPAPYGHRFDGELQPEEGLPLLRGWDFGLTPACVIAQLQGTRLVILREYVSKNMGIKRFAGDVVMPALRNEFPAWTDQGKHWIDCIDPAGDGRAQTDETTCAQHLMMVGCRRIVPGPITWEERRSAVEFFLLGRTKAGPNLLISSTDAPMLTKGFRGGYRYPETFAEKEPTKIRPVKDMYSHCHDALQYAAAVARGFTRSSLNEAPPAPSYRRGIA